MANVVLTQNGLDFVNSATSDDGILIKVGYFIPVYDHRIDGSIRTVATTSAFSAIADESLTAPIGEKIWNTSGSYAVSDQNVYLISASSYSDGAGTYTSPFQDDSREINLYNGIPLSNHISASDMTVDTSTLVWTLSDDAGVAGSNNRPTNTSSDYFAVQDFYPVRLSGTNELRGNFRCVLQKDIGKVRFNKIALYAIAMQNGIPIDGNETFFAECYLNDPITKTGLSTDGFDSLVMDFQMDLHSVSADWTNVFFGTSADYFALVPNGLHSPAKVSIGNFDSSQTPNEEPQASLHLGNHRNDSNVWDTVPQLRVDYRNTNNKLEMNVVSGGDGTVAITQIELNDVPVMSLSSTSAIGFIGDSLVSIADGTRNAWVGGDVYRIDEDMLICSKVNGNKSYTYRIFLSSPVSAISQITHDDVTSAGNVVQLRFNYGPNSYVGVTGSTETENNLIAVFGIDINNYSNSADGLDYCAQAVQAALREYIDTRGTAATNNNYNKNAFVNTKFTYNRSLGRFQLVADKYDPCYITGFLQNKDSSGLGTVYNSLSTYLYGGSVVTNSEDSVDVDIFAGDSNTSAHSDVARQIKYKNYDNLSTSSKIVIASKDEVRIAGDLELQSLSNHVGSFLYTRGKNSNLTIVAGLREGMNSYNISANVNESYPPRWDKIAYYGDTHGGYIDLVASQITLYTVSAYGDQYSGYVYFGGNLAPSLSGVYNIGSTNNKVKSIYSQYVGDAADYITKGWFNNLVVDSLTATNIILGANSTIVTTYYDQTILGLKTIENLKESNDIVTDWNHASALKFRYTGSSNYGTIFSRTDSWDSSINGIGMSLYDSNGIQSSFVHIKTSLSTGNNINIINGAGISTVFVNLIFVFESDFTTVKNAPDTSINKKVFKIIAPISTSYTEYYWPIFAASQEIQFLMTNNNSYNIGYDGNGYVGNTVYSAPNLYVYFKYNSSTGVYDLNINNRSGKSVEIFGYYSYANA